MHLLAILDDIAFVASRPVVILPLQPVQAMGHRLEFCSATDQVSFLLTLVQVYRLLAVMSAVVPQLLWRWPLYSEIARENSMYVSERSISLCCWLHGNCERCC